MSREDQSECLVDDKNDNMSSLTSSALFDLFCVSM
jgi:hypothetical protein